MDRRYKIPDEQRDVIEARAHRLAGPLVKKRLEQKILDVRLTLWAFHGHECLRADNGTMWCEKCCVDFKHGDLATLVQIAFRAVREEKEE